MKSIPNTLHSGLLKLLESLPDHVNGSTVRDLEFKRKAALLRKKLERCKNTNNESATNQPREEQR